jgi:lipopolysaccharide export system permease protein
MRILYGMILRAFVPLFVIAVLFFVLMLQIMDLFANISRYVAVGVDAVKIATIALYYIPQCIAFSIPVAFLFGISYTLGLFYTNNELFAIFGSGVSLYRLVVPFLITGLFLSLGGFFFQDSLVIPTVRTKAALYSAAIRSTPAASLSNATVLSGNGGIVYQADYYNDALKRLDGVTLVVRGADGVLEQRIDAQYGEWKEGRWIFHDCRIFTWNTADGVLSDQHQSILDSTRFSEPPDTFKRPTRNVSEMTRSEAELYVSTLRRTGFPYLEPITDYYRKFSFACTPLIVALIASSLGSTFRKNILLMSLLSVLVIAVVYYVAQIVSAQLSKYGYIPPLAGAWSPFSLFLVLGFMLFRTART